MIMTITMAILLINNTNDGNMDFCNSNVQCVINQATSNTKIKLADNMWEYLLQSFRFLYNIFALISRVKRNYPQTETLMNHDTM